MGVAVADFDNDGWPDLFVTGVYRNTLYHNNGNGTFTDVTAQAGLDHSVDPEYGPLWAVAAAWVDVNNDGLLDLFVVNYVQWKYSTEPQCAYKGVGDYCHPKFFKPLPNQLFLNRGHGKFEDVSAAWGIRAHPGKGMGVGVADYDLDGKPDIFVTNDAYYNSLFHNTGNKFDEVAFEAGVALPEDGSFVSGMGLDFRDLNNDGYPDIAFVALNNQTLPIFQNTGKGEFREVTSETGMRQLTLSVAGFGVGFTISITMAGRIFLRRAATYRLLHNRRLVFPPPMVLKSQSLMRTTPSSVTQARAGNGNRSPKKPGLTHPVRRATGAAPSVTWMATGALTSLSLRWAVRRKYG